MRKSSCGQLRKHRRVLNPCRPSKQVGCRVPHRTDLPPQAQNSPFSCLLPFSFMSASKISTKKAVIYGIKCCSPASKQGIGFQETSHEGSVRARTCTTRTADPQRRTCPKIQPFLSLNLSYLDSKKGDGRGGRPGRWCREGEGREEAGMKEFGSKK